MPMDIPEWRNVDRHLFETQILPAGRPAVFKGAVDTGRWCNGGQIHRLPSSIT